MTRYSTAISFRQALEHRLLNQARAEPAVPLVRLRKAVAFEALLRRLVADQPDYWLVKGGFALQLRLGLHARTTKDLDLRPAGEIDDGEHRFRDAAQRAVEDFFSFQIAPATVELTGAPGGGRRFQVRTLLAGRRFEDFHVDLGSGDALVGPIEKVSGTPVLEALGYAAIGLPLYPVMTSVAEKLHAYTLPRLTSNTRVRDLVDLILLKNSYDFDARELARACRISFERRDTHLWPPTLEAPPSSWDQPFQRLREESRLRSRTAGEAHLEFMAFLDPVLRGQQARWRHSTHSWSAPTDQE